MSGRASRIRHPPGARFFMQYAWIIEAVGKHAAAVVGVLDFLDRAQPMAGVPVASRQRIITELEGLVGRSNVDIALDQLVKLEWVTLHACVIHGERNIQKTHLYSLNADVISRFQESRSSNFRTPGVLKPEPEPVPISELVDIGEEPEKEQKQQQAGQVGGVGAALGAAAAPVPEEQKRKSPRRWPSGLESWFASEDPAAEHLERDVPAAELKAAVAAVRAKTNLAGNPKSPVPAVVIAELGARSEKAAAEAAETERLAAISRRDAAALAPEKARQRARAARAALRLGSSP